MKYLSLFAIIITTLSLAAPTALENTIIDTLVEAKILEDQSKNPEKYAINNRITRAETLGIALKMSNARLEERYFCRNYFIDVKYDRLNNWICRAVEKAADLGIISRKNNYARPHDPITRLEALAIVMRAGNIPYEKDIDRTPYPLDMEQWAIDILDGALRYNIISSSTDFHPQKLATRMDVFGIVYNASFAGKYQHEVVFDTSVFDSAPEENTLTVVIPWKPSEPVKNSNVVILDAAPGNTLPNQNTVNQSNPPPALTSRAVDFTVEAKPTVGINTPFDITVTILDQNKKIVEDFTGTFFLRTRYENNSEILTESWRRYKFQPTDKGKHTLKGVYTFKKKGTYEISLITQFPALAERRISVMVQESPTSPVSPSSPLIIPTPTPPVLPTTTPTTDTVTTPQSSTLTYRFQDSSIIPEYHRSYTITVSPEKIHFSIDAYKKILSEKTLVLDKKAYETFVKKIIDLKLSDQNTSTTNACVGGTSEAIDIDLPSYVREATYYGECSTNSAPASFVSAVVLFKNLVPNLNDLIEATFED